MFLFSWCCQSESKLGYQITKTNQKNKKLKSFVNSLNQVSKKDLKDQNVKIISLEKSEYQQIMKQFKGTDKKWTDIYFPPDQNSLGEIPDLTTNKWKRISDLLNKPALFDGKIEPKDVIQRSGGNCYFLSALAALAEDEQLIKNIFGQQQYNPNGIYKVTLRINGVILEIIIDDYIPVNSRGQALFCQPNKNQFWVLLVQKAWAKAHGCYANIIAGTPAQVFRAVTYAPALTYFIKQSEEQRQRIWKMIFTHSTKNYPCCCGTDQRQNVDWQKIGLIPGHAYTLIDAVQLQDKSQNYIRMLLMRNPWGNLEWQGQGSQNDEEFWQNIVSSQSKNLFLSNNNKANDGIFFMTFNDFCKYFSQIHFCMLQQKGSYNSQKLFTNKKNGSLYNFQVEKKAELIFELHQSGTRGMIAQKIQNGLSRSTLLVARVTPQNQYQFVNGSMKYNDEDTTLRVQLTPGKYILFAKLDPIRNSLVMPEKSSISVYSSNFIKLQLTQKSKHPDFLNKMFLNHAKLNKKKPFQNEKMWVAWKLLYHEGGYAYIAFFNSHQSKKKFIISFDEQQFNQLNFKLKKGFKNKGKGQTLQVFPGQQKIILCRVINTTFKGLKFPPAISIKTNIL